MKLFITVLLFLSTIVTASAQNLPRVNMPLRRIQFKPIGKDSINLAFNSDYELIEDSCAEITRYAHYNFMNRKFTGHFKDVSKLDTTLIVSEGFYTAEGLKNGPFISNYINGNHKSKGTYNNNNYEGRWETYYDNAKPQLIFEANNNDIKIIDAWNTEGKKIIDNGKGTYVVNLGYLSWKGKMDNGKPDGTWRAYKTDDATQSSMISETFKKGKFESGNAPSGDYTDASRLVLVNPDMFSFNHAEKMQISIVPCNGTKLKHIVNAQYENGFSSFSTFISMAVTDYISHYNIHDFHDQLTIAGVISTDGRIVDLNATSPIFSEAFVRGLINQFHTVPPLKPATADGKPVRQKFSITFTFDKGSYQYSYKFLAIDQKAL